jgi:ribonuclease III
VIPLRKPDDLTAWVERSFGYVFNTPALCHAALTHRSAGADHNERLEFLGDSILNCSVARLLYDAHPDADEGALSRLRASLVSGETLARIAAELGLGEQLNLGSGELKSGGFRRASILADALEAVLGAIYLDSNFDATFGVIARLMLPRISDLPSADALKDPKTRLQEILQARGLALPVYVLTAVAGDPHAQSFTVTCEVPVFRVMAVAEGASRRRAEQLAAAKVLEMLPAELRKSP